MARRQRSSESAVTNAIAVRPQGAMRLNGRRIMSWVLAPTAPITDWLRELDKRTGTSPAFFVGRPIILDLQALTLEETQIGELITQLGERGVRVMALEGIDADQLGASLPPLLKRGRPTPRHPLFSPSSTPNSVPP